MNKRLLTAPTVEPVSLPEAKDHLGLQTADFDAAIFRFIATARRHVEARTQRAIVRQKWRLYLDAFQDELALEPQPVQEIDQIQYIDSDGATQTLSTSIYELDVAGQRLLKAYNQTWPATRSQANAVWVDVWAGYYDPSTSPVKVLASIPEDLKSAILLMVGHQDQNREKGIIGTSYVELPDFDYLIQPYRVFQ